MTAKTFVRQGGQWKEISVSVHLNGAWKPWGDLTPEERVAVLNARGRPQRIAASFMAIAMLLQSIAMVAHALHFL